MEFWGPFCQWLPFPASPIFPISVAPTSQALLQPRRGPVWSRSCHRRWRSSRSWRPVAPWPRAEWAKMDAILNVDNFALWKQCWFSIAMRLPRLVSTRVPMVIVQHISISQPITHWIPQAKTCHGPGGPDTGELIAEDALADDLATWLAGLSFFQEIHEDSKALGAPSILAIIIYIYISSSSPLLMTIPLQSHYIITTSSPHFAIFKGTYPKYLTVFIASSQPPGSRSQWEGPSRPYPGVWTWPQTVHWGDRGHRDVPQKNSWLGWERQDEQNLESPLAQWIDYWFSSRTWRLPTLFRDGMHNLGTKGKSWFVDPPWSAGFWHKIQGKIIASQWTLRNYPHQPRPQLLVPGTSGLESRWWLRTWTVHGSVPTSLPCPIKKW